MTKQKEKQKEGTEERTVRVAKINGARLGSARKQWQGGLVLIPLESGQMFLGKTKKPRCFE